MSTLLKRAAALQLVDLDDIVINGGTQPRAALSQETIADYAEALTNGADFPPVILYYDGQNYWLADGFHRYHAHRKAQLVEINAYVRQGDRRAAVLYSVGANSEHGLRRTADDKRRAVLRLLEDDEWGKWSNREIARQCRVSDPFVGKMRETLTANVSGERTYTTKHGTTAVMNTSNITVAAERRAANANPVQTALGWLQSYTDDRERTWRDLEDNQVHHANSPCCQAFVKAHPMINDPKTALKMALTQLRNEAGTLQRINDAENQSPASPRPLTQVEAEAAIVRWLDRHYPSVSDGRKLELVLGANVHTFAPMIVNGRSLDPSTLQSAKMQIADQLRKRIDAARPAPASPAKVGLPADTSIGVDAAADMIRSIIAAGGNHPEIDDYAAAAWASAIEAEYGRRPMVQVARQALGGVVRERRTKAQPPADEIAALTDRYARAAPQQRQNVREAVQDALLSLNSVKADANVLGIASLQTAINILQNIFDGVSDQ